ncbi:hypothetical protein SAMN02799630_04449 [Paenibacillus sp. UNCCL117]|uniref:hypothetical protein n=1 Tax=unclassified Paenibacillus TaxID=185978 RepID=UPI00088AD7BE|nr:MULTISPECIES: hypothetical protein [unclassified Paenibacillus]SDE03014.1 hypothetical protein SAMN04488602_11758 [Paenibacillus sp. cl123]SFW57324.1 hypothetical protein SAMN02799630_04449 [Paenibacillus sp. UNCCL117]
MDFLMEFIQDRWFVIAGAIIVLFIVVKLVKTVMKWVLIIALLAGLYYYGASYKDQLLELGGAVGAQAAAEVKTQVVKAFGDEVKEASYKQNADGSFTVTTKSVRLDGKPGESEVKVTFMNRSFTVKMDDVMKALIDQAKKNAGLQ